MFKGVLVFRAFYLLIDYYGIFDFYIGNMWAVQCDRQRL